MSPVAVDALKEGREVLDGLSRCAVAGRLGPALGVDVSEHPRKILFTDHKRQTRCRSVLGLAKHPPYRVQIAEVVAIVGIVERAGDEPLGAFDIVALAPLLHGAGVTMKYGNREGVLLD